MSAEMEIQVKHLTHKTYTLKVNKELSVAELKNML